MKLRSTYVIALSLFTAISAGGQAIVGFSSSLNEHDGVYTGTANIRVSPYLRPALLNAPYSGQMVTENSQTLADGTHINRPGGRQEKTWRDSQGRVRTERPMFGPRRDPDAPALIAEITDPVAGYVYVLDNVNKVAHRVRISPPPQRAAAVMRNAPANAPGVTGDPGSINGTPNIISGVLTVPGGGGGVGGAGGGVIRTVPRNSPDAAHPRPDVTIEDLGSKTIDGVLVYGTRRTVIIPEGEEGNDRPMTTTGEEWVSKDLHLTVLSTHYNPASGTSTTRIANLSTSEPDPALFMVPAGYTVVDEEKSFTITWGEK
jgi:hypothetical protein